MARGRATSRPHPEGADAGGAVGDTRRETEDTQGKVICEETITTYTPHRVCRSYNERRSVWAETATEEAGPPFDSVWRASAPVQCIAGKVQLLGPQASGKYEPGNASCPGPQTSRSFTAFGATFSPIVPPSAISMTPLTPHL